jgi:hypothetical protein
MGKLSVQEKNRARKNPLLKNVEGSEYNSLQSLSHSSGVTTV